MKRSILMAVLCILFNRIISQQVIDAAGFYGKNTSFNFQYSIGEIQTITIPQNGTNKFSFLTCGVIQPDPLFISNDQSPGVSKSIWVFPNPVRNKLIIHEQTSTYTEFWIAELTGKKILQGSIENKSIDLTTLETGVYFLFMSNKWGDSKTFRIIKIN